MKKIDGKLEFNGTSSIMTIDGQTETKTNWSIASNNRNIKYLSFYLPQTLGLQVCSVTVIYWAGIEVIPLILGDNVGQSLTIAIKPNESITTGYINFTMLCI